ncbi:MAG: helix-turn-helix domain-containing protein [Calothrix sp. FI2-JRJ7]|jgi:ribosome-binding protein aMBF1 (putative translation factor)|nr:helix-turn-helix domain-containing protein [Calothrix sp. FI2-JRJ7]
MTAVYSLSIPGKSAIDISQDELRSILGEIEAELHRSKVYRRALATVKKMFGESSEQASQLFKAVGREAIGLAFHQFAKQQQQIKEVQPDAASSQDSVNNEEKIELEENVNHSVEHNLEPNGDLSECLTSAKFHSKAEHETDAVADNGNSPSVEVKSAGKSNLSLPWLNKNKNKKPSKAELALVAAAEQRIKTLNDIGQQLRQARELKGMSLTQLNIYTHVPVHQMEAIENGKWENLPEEVYVRGFIRVMGNALGLNGTNLVASLPAPEPAKTIAPVWYKEQKSSSGGIGLNIKPMHLYVGYTALVAGAVSGLSLMSQQAEAKRLLPDTNTPSSSSFTQTSKDKETNTKPGLQSNGKVSVGADIAPPEAL